MAVRSDNGWLSVTFPFKGKRRTEYLGLKDSRDNRRFGQRLNDQVKAELKAGNFKYEKHFPNSKYISGLPAAVRANNPTLRHFAEEWLKEIAATVTPETLSDYTTLLHAHIFDHELS